MKKIFTSISLTLGLMASLLLPALAPTFVSATGVDVFSNCGSATGAGGDNNVCGAANKDDFTTLMHNVINAILFVLGMIAVIMIVIGGIRYTTSNGDSAQITSAKNTILYAVVGLVIAILSYAIVNFVIAQFKK